MAFGLRRLALLMTLSLVAAACSGDSPAPRQAASAAGKKSLAVGAVFDVSGPTSELGAPYSQGVRDYVDWRNAHGGLDGLEIKLRWGNSKGLIPIAEQLYSQFIRQGAVAFVGWGPGDTEALRSRIDSDQIPFMSAAYPETLTDPGEAPFNFVSGTTYSDQMRIALRWIAGQSKERTEVAVFHQHSPFGKSPIADGEAYVKDKGLDIGYRAYPMPTGAPDYGAQIEQAKQQGARWIIVQNGPEPAAKLSRDVARQKLNMRILNLSGASNELFIQLAGLGSEGVVGVMPFAASSLPVKGLDEPREFLERKGDNLNGKSVPYLQGWYTMAAIAEGMAAVVKTGQEEFSGSALKAALEKVALDTGEVTTEPIRFSPTSHKGLRSARLFKVQGGQWTKLTDALTP